MSDIIDRQAAIDSIMEEPPEVRYPTFYAEKIKQLPSAQAWIPTSERLPEKDGRYMVTFRDNVYFSPFEDGEWYIVGVTAWQEIPEPYREDGDDGV